MAWPPRRNVAGLRDVHGARSKADEELGFWSLRANQLRSCSNARRVRRIAAADRRDGRRAPTLRDRNARRSWQVVDATGSDERGLAVRYHSGRRKNLLVS